MTPVHQTRQGAPHGNCVAACVASILERPLEDVDVDVSDCTDNFALIRRIEAKANCTIYRVDREAITEGVVISTQRYCYVSVCTFVFNGDPNHQLSGWHAVVCEIGPDGKISLVHNPDKRDQRQKSLDEFPAVASVYFVKPHSDVCSTVPSRTSPNREQPRSALI